jgi:antitoxin VapB
MTAHRTKPFQSGNSQAVRLPKDIAFAPETELVMVRSGDVLTIYPASLSVPDMLSRLAAMPTPPRVEVRDDDELPEPAGL